MPTTDNSLGGLIAIRAAHRDVESALPWAPVVAEPTRTARGAARRRITAKLLRACASSTTRLADRLDPHCA